MFTPYPLQIAKKERISLGAAPQISQKSNEPRSALGIFDNAPTRDGVFPGYEVCPPKHPHTKRHQDGTNPMDT